MHLGAPPRGRGQSRLLYLPTTTPLSPHASDPIPTSLSFTSRRIAPSLPALSLRLYSENPRFRVHPPLGTPPSFAAQSQGCTLTPAGQLRSLPSTSVRVPAGISPQNQYCTFSAAKHPGILHTRACWEASGSLQALPFFSGGLSLLLQALPAPIRRFILSNLKAPRQHSTSALHRIRDRGGNRARNRGRHRIRGRGRDRSKGRGRNNIRGRGRARVRGRGQGTGWVWV